MSSKRTSARGRTGGRSSLERNRGIGAAALAEKKSEGERPRSNYVAKTKRTPSQGALADQTNSVSMRAKALARCQPIAGPKLWPAWDHFLPACRAPAVLALGVGRRARRRRRRLLGAAGRRRNHAAPLAEALRPEQR